MYDQHDGVCHALHIVCPVNIPATTFDKKRTCNNVEQLQRSKPKQQLMLIGEVISFRLGERARLNIPRSISFPLRSKRPKSENEHSFVKSVYLRSNIIKY